jgi:hypothetical protein
MSETTDRIQASTASHDVKEALEAMRKEYLSLGSGGGGDGEGPTLPEGAIAPKDVQANLDALKATVIVDLNNLHDAVVHTLTHLDELGAKLNADAGVTDVDYYTENALDDSPPAITTA